MEGREVIYDRFLPKLVLHKPMMPEPWGPGGPVALNIWQVTGAPPRIAKKPE